MKLVIFTTLFLMMTLLQSNAAPRNMKLKFLFEDLINTDDEDDWNIAAVKLIRMFNEVVADRYEEGLDVTTCKNTPIMHRAVVETLIDVLNYLGERNSAESALRDEDTEDWVPTPVEADAISSYRTELLNSLHQIAHGHSAGCRYIPIQILEEYDSKDDGETDSSLGENTSLTFSDDEEEEAEHVWGTYEKGTTEENDMDDLVTVGGLHQILESLKVINILWVISQSALILLFAFLLVCFAVSIVLTMVEMIFPPLF